jgi:DNA-binding response OmpR family regulator/DNA-binding SARP family transcriptional activator
LLLLEDDADMREALAEALSMRGYHVEATCNGREAVEAAATSVFDVIITDIRMSGMDGLDALAHIKQHRPEVGSLVITAYGGESDTIRALRLGAGDYLRKPFQLSEFLASVERVVGSCQRQQRQQRREQSQQHLLADVLEAVAQWQPSSPYAARACRLADRLAREVGFDQARRLELHVGIALALLRHAPGFPRLLQRHELPPLTRRVLRATAGPSSTPAADLSLPARIATLALIAAEEPEWRSTVETQRPDLLDEALAAALQAVPETDLEGEPAGAPGSNGAAPDSNAVLAQLGRALELAGDRQAAARAFEKLLERLEQDGSRRPEAVQALLGQARLAVAAGNPDIATACLQRGVEVARQLGPTGWGQYQLEAGVMLLRVGRHDAARDMLVQARRVLDDIGLQPGAALARLALLEPPAAFDDAARESVEWLLRPEFTAEVLDALPWLYPRLAAWHVQQPHAVVERLLHRLALACPREVIGLSTDEATRRLTDSLLPDVVDSQAPLLRLQSLGPFEVSVGDARVPEAAWKGSKNKYLLAFLAASHPDPVPEDIILEHFWPGDAERGRRNLYNAKNVIVRAITPADWKGEVKYVVREGGMLRLDRTLPIWHDVDELERLDAEANQLAAAGDSASSLERCRSMARLYRGRYLEGCYMDWALERRGRLERLMTAALLRLANNALERRQGREALDHAQQLLDIDPWLQEAHLVAMQAHLLDGRPEQAMRQFETCRKRLAADLDMEPTIALLECFHKARLGLTPGTP